MHHIQQLVITYGYWLMAFGAIIEGETFLLAGGIAAQQGLLHLPGLILLALIGSTIHDNCFFFIGRYWGGAFLQKRPQFNAKADIVLRQFDRFGVWLVLTLRFFYGVRTIIPTVLGMSHISTKKFIFFDVIGGVVWSCVFILGGYLFGHAFEFFLKRFSYYEAIGEHILVLAIIVLVIGYIIWHIRNWLFRKK